MVISQIRSRYRDANDLLRTVIKRVYEEWNPAPERWRLKKIEFLFPDDDLPVHTVPKPPSSVNTAGSSRPNGNLCQKSENLNASRRAVSGTTTRVKLGLLDETWFRYRVEYLNPNPPS